MTNPTPAPLLEDDLPTIAYMVCGGRLYKDQPVTGLLTAEDRVATRKDGSRAEALVSRAAHEDRIARLLAHIAELERDKAEAERLAADRLDLMNADRKQALAWRDRVAALEAAIRSDFDPAWDCTSCHPKLSKIGSDLISAIASEARKP